MDINVLVLNLGNSRLALGGFRAGELAHSQRATLDQRADWRGMIAQAWTTLDDADAGIAIASVNPKLEHDLAADVLAATGQESKWVGREIDLPIAVKTDAPAETGVDRVLNIAAAYEQMQKACVVVDAGTAITVDCCNEKGDFLGGAIAPGATLMLEALHAHTAKLPRVTLEAPIGAFGKSTVEAIRAGVYHGLRGMVKELVETYATELGNWPDIIATGGDAQRLFGGWELIHAIAPDLTLYGIALAYTEHHIRHDT